MTKLSTLTLLILAAGVSQSAFALEGGVDAGEKFTNIHVGLGTDSPGLALSGEWMRSDHDGNYGNLGLSYGLGSDSWMISPGVKVMRANPKDSKDGFAALVGGDLKVSLTQTFKLYGQLYWSPDSWSEHTNGFYEAGGGLSFQPVSIVDVKIGYKYAGFEGKNGRKDNVIADGPFIGAALHF